jgi:ribonuclease HI
MSSAVGIEAVLWTDGASRRNPGPAAIGAILKSREGHVLGEWSESIGIATNNQAEYRALIVGLAGALELGVSSIEVRADSQLVIRQLRGEYRVLNRDLLALHWQARELLRRFRATALVFVPRAENAEADRLANQALDREKA